VNIFEELLDERCRRAKADDPDRRITLSSEQEERLRAWCREVDEKSRLAYEPGGDWILGLEASVFKDRMIAGLKF